MIPKNFLILSIVISLLSHLVILSLTGLIDMGGSRNKADYLSVEFNQTFEEIQQPLEDELKRKPPPPPMEEPVGREETVNLNSRDSRYAPYLKKVKRRIEKVWTYPPRALERNQQGTTDIRFSIDRDGTLAAVQVLKTSGFVFIDEGTVGTVRDAAPYEPLPRELSRLHILATFQYNLAE